MLDREPRQPAEPRVHQSRSTLKPFTPAARRPAAAPRGVSQTSQSGRRCPHGHPTFAWTARFDYDFCESFRHECLGPRDVPSLAPLAMGPSVGHMGSSSVQYAYVRF